MRYIRTTTFYAGTLLIGFTLLVGCVQVFQRTPIDKTQIPHHQPSRIYMRNGDLYLADSVWLQTNPELRETLLAVYGYRYNAERTLIDSGTFLLQMDQIVFLAMDQYDKTVFPSVAMSSVPIVAFATASIICFIDLFITDLKICFGSCPVFYVQACPPTTAQQPAQCPWRIAGEGFSDAIINQLKTTDIDRIGPHPPMNNPHYPLLIKNEALETHYIDYVRLIAIPHNPHEEVHTDATEKEFWRVHPLNLPIHVTGYNHQDITPLVQAPDNTPYKSPAARYNLAQKEKIRIRFQTDQPQQLGLIIRYRQTLMTTFLLYHSIAYMGNYYVDWLAATEQGTNDSAWVAQHFRKLKQLIGQIQVQYKGQTIATISETGPIAWNTAVIDLGTLPSGNHEITLVATRGYWQIDYLKIGTLQPVPNTTRFVLEPQHPPEQPATAHPSQPLFPRVLLPGDSLLLYFHLPDTCLNTPCHLFIESRGYYHEWPRYEWLEQQALWKILMLKYFPGLYFRWLAPQYKKIEDSLDYVFWNSKVNQKLLQEIPSTQTAKPSS